MPMKIIIKVGEEQHKFLLLREDICQNIEEVKQFCYSRFPKLPKRAELRVFWNDQDGDEISIVTDDDFTSFILAAGEDKRRLYVEAKKATEVDASVGPMQSAPDADSVASRPVHRHIVCDVCHREIVGHRYRCLTCYEYNLCMTCESKYRHKDHIMLRIPHPLRSRVLPYRVLEKLKRCASKLELASADGDVGGKKLVTVALDNNRTEKIQKKRCKPVKVASDSEKHQKRATTGKVANDRVKERAPGPLPGVNDVLGQSSFSRSAHVYRPSCPAYIRPDDPLESHHCKAKCVSVLDMKCAKHKFCTHVPGHVSEPSLEKKTAKVTAPTGSMVSGLVDGVLKHTPPEFKKFLPTEDEMNRVGGKLSTLLGHLGLELNMPPTENEKAPSSIGSVIAQAGSTVSEDANEESEVSVAAANDDNDQSEAVVAGKEQDTVSQGGKTALETDSVSVGASLGGETVTEQPKGPAVDNDECSADTSSASMLTDDEGDEVQAEQVSKQTDSSAAKEVPWILVDLPEEEVKQNEDNNSPTTSSAKPDASPDKEQSMEIAEDSEGEPEDVDDDAIRSLIEYTKTRLEMLRKNSLKEGKVDDRVKVVFEKLYKDLEKLKLDQTAEECKEQVEQQQHHDGASVSEPTDEKKILPEATTSSASAASTTPVPPVRTSSALKGSNVAVIAAPRTQTAAPLRTYSRRPHVNHAIHTMMTMGFSNSDGRLTHLLEILNGNISLALDKLLQKVP